MTTTQLSRYLIKQALQPMTHTPAKGGAPKGSSGVSVMDAKGSPADWGNQQTRSPAAVAAASPFSDQELDTLSEQAWPSSSSASSPTTPAAPNPLGELGALPSGTLTAATGFPPSPFGVAPNAPAASLANRLGGTGAAQPVSNSGTGASASIAGPGAADVMTIPSGSAANAFQLPSFTGKPDPVNPATAGANPYGAPQNPAPQATSAMPATAAPWSAGRLGDPHAPIQQSRQPTSVENVTPQYDMESLSKMNEQDRHNFMMASMGHGYTEQNGAGTSKFFSPTGNGQVQQTATISPDANTPGKRNLTSIYGTGSSTLGAPVGGPDRKTMVDGIPRFGDDPMRRSIVNPPAQGADLLPGEAWGKAAAKQAALHFALSCVKFAAAVANSPPIVSLHETPGSSPMAAKFTKTAPVVKEKIPLQVTV